MSLPGACKSEVPSRCAWDGKEPETSNRAPTSAQPARGRVSTKGSWSPHGTRYLDSCASRSLILLILPPRAGSSPALRRVPRDQEQPSSPPQKLEPSQFNWPRGRRPSCRSPLLPRLLLPGPLLPHPGRGELRTRRPFAGLQEKETGHALLWRASCPGIPRRRRKVRSSRQGLGRKNPATAFQGSPRGSAGPRPTRTEGGRAPHRAERGSRSGSP